MIKNFVKDLWITGLVDNIEIIGRTAIVNGKEMVVIVTSEGTSGVVKISDVQKISKINFVDKTRKQNMSIARKPLLEQIKTSLNNKHTLN